MDIRQFRAELAEAFRTVGFERKKIKGTPTTIWLLPGREVDREFWEHAIRRPWGFLLSGSLSIDVPAFREWLNSSFPKEQHGIVRSSLLNRHIANEPEMFLGVEREQPPYLDWVVLIRNRLSSLPDTVEGLLAAKDEPERLRFLWDSWAAPKAWDYFEKWATGDAPRSPPPFSTPDGQIVDSAANDTA